MDIKRRHSMKTTTLFFRSREKAWAMAQAIGSRADCTVLNYGQTKRGLYYITYRKEA